MINSLPTRIAVRRFIESNGPRNVRAIYASFNPCNPNFVIIAKTANAKGIAPIAKISSASMSNWTAIMMIGMRVTGITASLQFIAQFLRDSNISE